MEGGRIVGMRWETTHPVVRIVSVYFECGYVVEDSKTFYKCLDPATMMLVFAIVCAAQLTSVVAPPQLVPQVRE